MTLGKVQLILQQKIDAEMAPKSQNDYSNVLISGTFSCGVPCLSLSPSRFVTLHEGSDSGGGRRHSKWKISRG